MKFKNTITLALALSSLHSCVGMDNSIVSTPPNFYALCSVRNISKQHPFLQKNIIEKSIFTAQEMTAFTIPADTQSSTRSSSEKMKIIMEAAEKFVNSSPQERYITWAEVLINTSKDQTVVTRYKKELLLFEQLEKLAQEIEIKREKIKQEREALHNVIKENTKLKRALHRQEKKQQQIEEQKRENDLLDIRNQLEIAAKKKEQLTYLLEREEKRERIIEALKKEKKIKEEKRKTNNKQPIQRIKKDPASQKLTIKRKLMKANGCHTEMKLKTIFSNFCVNRKNPIPCFFEKFNSYEALHYSHKMNDKVVKKLTILIGDEIDSYKCHQCDSSPDDESFD